MSTHVDEHLLIYNPDNAADALGLLLWQHKGKPRIEALVAALAAGAQLQENTIWAVIIGATTLAGAEGKNLDRWGALVGEFRGGLDEEQYRKFISLRIRVNTEFPNEDNVASVLFEAVDPSVRGNPFGSAMHYLADGVKIHVQSDEAFLDEAVKTHVGALMRDFRPAATFMAVVESVTDHFAFSWEATDPVKPTPEPFAGLSIPGTGVISRLIYSGR